MQVLANVCCNYKGFEVLLQLCWWYFLLAAITSVDLFVAITPQVTVSVAIKQLEVSAAFMQVKVSAANIWATVFIEVRCDSLAIMQVLFSVVHYALFLLQLCR